MGKCKKVSSIFHAPAHEKKIDRQTDTQIDTPNEISNGERGFCLF